ncbi:MAG: hypothetical protein KW802_02130 [Candidatus Doudnabacteria bacterium]|nr:hypothetical protein [Candidatus Doudnabacteria bacterium]
MKSFKILAMGLLAAITWIADWLLLERNIYQNHSLAFIGWPSIATILGITFLTFFFVTNRNRLLSLILDGVIVIGYLVIMPKAWYVLLAGVIFLIFLQLFEHRLAEEGKSRLDFSIRRVMMHSISLTIYALLLLIGLNVYHSTRLDFNANQDAYYERLEKAAAAAANRTVPYISKTLNAPVSDEQSHEIAEILAHDTVDNIRQSSGAYQQYFPLILAIIVTGLLSTFAFLLRWATVVVSWIIFKILVATGFFKLEKEMVEVEKLTI